MIHYSRKDRAASVQQDHTGDADFPGGHRPPPYYKVKDDDYPRRQYIPEAGTGGDEDISNYGRGGYYGSTYDQAGYARQRQAIPADRHGSDAGYRDLGDRRWYGAERPWEVERHERPGYRPLRERLALANHRGKGPRSWRRPDHRIFEDINDRLCDDPWVNASDVAVEVHHGEVFLTGTVDGRAAKRRVEDIAESISGVQYVENRLRVKKDAG